MGQDVALLTRIDPEGDQIRRDARKGQSGPVLKAVSKNYIATLPVGTTRISLIGLHLLAEPLNESRRLERQAQADAIRAMARDERAAGALVVVLGNFNDYDGNADSVDHIDSTPISTVLSDIRAMNPSDTTDDLTNVASLIPKANRFTTWFDRNDNEMVEPPEEFTSIDHVLLSLELVALVETVEFPDELNPPDVSDQFPLVVRLRMAGGTPPTGGAQRIISLLPNPIAPEAPRVRTVDLALVALIQEATDRSPTFRQLRERIQASDGIVYIVRGRCGYHVRACLVLWVGIALPNRLLRVVVDLDQADHNAMASIAHELRHALEVLDEPSVRTAASMFLFYYPRNRLRQDRTFETEAAVDAGNTVLRELRKGTPTPRIEH